jgi:hypothetical protein
MIRKVEDKQRRTDLLNDYEQATVPMTLAINASHKFVYTELGEYLTVAQGRIEKLMSKIANRAN